MLEIIIAGHAETDDASTAVVDHYVVVVVLPVVLAAWSVAAVALTAYLAAGSLAVIVLEHAPVVVASVVADQ